MVLGIGAAEVRSTGPHSGRGGVAFPDDTDNDGLVDKLESVLSSVFVQQDSDQDGFSDAEEFARQSSPVFALSQPVVGQIQVGMSAYGKGGEVHGVVGVYAADGNFYDKNITLGMMIHGQLSELPSTSWVQSAQIRMLAGAAPGSRIALIDFPIDSQLVHTNRDISMYTTVGLSGSGSVSAADTIHLVSILGIVVLVTPDPTVMPIGMTASRGGYQAQQAPGTIYVPLTADESGDLPLTWTQGSVCMQTTSAVGSDGAAVTQQVDSADCQDGFDSACPSTCSASVGSTFTTIDPVVLIGG